MRPILRHKETGDEIVGFYEKCPCCARAEDFCLEDGQLVATYLGDSNMWWDDQEIVKDELTGDPYLVTENNAVVPFSECEFIEEAQS